MDIDQRQLVREQLVLIGAACRVIVDSFDEGSEEEVYEQTLNILSWATSLLVKV